MFSQFFKKYDVYFWRQCLLSLAVTIDCFLGGAGLTFSATLLPQLQNNSTYSTIQITENEATWIASMTCLGCIPGTIAGSLMLESMGAKWCYALVAVGNILSWLLIACSKAVWHLLLGRGLEGFALGCGYAPLYCFVSEVALLKYRSTLFNLINVGVTSGMLFVDVIGTYYAWTLSAWLLTALSTFYLTIFLYLNNTHSWYLNRNRYNEAKQAFFWYRKEEPNAMSEFNDQVDKAKSCNKISTREFFKECTKRAFLRPLFIVGWFFTTVIFSGGIGIMLYSVTIMQDVVSIDEYLATVIIDLIRISTAFIIIILLKYLPVRSIVNVSSVLCASCLLILSASLYWEALWSGFSWLIIGSIFLFTFFYNLGYCNVANITLGELFTGISKSFGTSISAMYFFAVYFAFAQIVPTMFKHLGNMWTFLIFAISNIIGGIGLYFILPETKNVTNDEIRAMFQKSSSIVVVNDKNKTIQ